MTRLQDEIKKKLSRIFKQNLEPKIPGDHLEEAYGGNILSFKKSGQAFTIFIALVIGILGAYGAILFRYLILLVHSAFFQSETYSIELLTGLEIWQRLLFPAIGGLLVGLIVFKLAPEVKGSGIPEVMEAVALKGGIIRMRVLFTKAVAAAITIGSGGSAGREGPIVHIGSAIGSAIGQVLKVSTRNLRTFVACGAAAAIAATFNAPIAGALFAMEVVVGEMKIVNMPPIIISSVIATVISRYYLGDFPAFVVPPYEMISPMELALYGLLGLLAGLISILFINIFLKSSQKFEKNKLPIWLKPAIGGLGVGIIGLFLPHVFGVGYESINAALWDKLELKILILILFAKLVATSLSLGSGGSGGVFAPSLFIGAALGASLGKIAHNYFPDWTANPGAYALVGMGAVVAGVTHAPISAILIIFELTNNYLIIPPLMVACIISILLSSQLGKRSIYLAKLESKGVNLSERKEVNLLRSIDVKSVMENEPVKIKSSTSFTEIMATLLGGKSHFAIVTGKDDSYVGTIELNDIREILPQADSLSTLLIANDIANTNVPFVIPSNNLDLVMHLFGKTERDHLAVCNNYHEKKVIGVVTKAAVINAYNVRIFQEDLTGGFGSIIDSIGEGRTIEVMGGMFIGEIDIRSSWVSKTIKEIDIRNKYFLEILMVHRISEQKDDIKERPGKFPAPDLVLMPGDKLLVLGSHEAIQNARR